MCQPEKRGDERQFPGIAVRFAGCGQAQGKGEHIKQQNGADCMYGGVNKMIAENPVLVKMIVQGEAQIRYSPCFYRAFPDGLGNIGQGQTF